jgi:hypothetical protein
MSMRVIWAAVWLVFLFVLGGCGDSGVKKDELPPMEFEGVKVDTPLLQSAFVDAPAELNSAVTDAATSLRYKRYMEGMMQLDEVLKKPGLTAKQKELLTKVIGQLKEVVAKTPAPPGQ